MEAMVLLESAGRPEVIAGDDPEAASGLAQIVASTGIDLLGMRIDLPLSQELTADYAANAGGRLGEGGSPRARRRRRSGAKAVRPAGELSAGTWRCCASAARSTSGSSRPRRSTGWPATWRSPTSVRPPRPGGGQLPHGHRQPPVGDRALRRRTPGAPTIAELVAAEDLDYAQLFFDSSPLGHRDAWDLLGSLRRRQLHVPVASARRASGSCASIARIATGSASSRGSTRQGDGGGGLPSGGGDRAVRRPGGARGRARGGELVAHPGRRPLRLRGRQPARPARRASSTSPLDPYRSLRPEALATLIYMTARVRAINDGEGALIVTSAVRDQEYQERPGRGQSRGDARLLAAHHRLLVRHPAQTTRTTARPRPSSSCSTGCGRWR